MDASEGTQELYRRGRAAAFVGLVVQVLLVAAMAVVAAWSRSDALVAATWHMLGGLPIWAILAVVYAQRAIERREALAADKIAADGDSAALLFGERDDELEHARRRLATLTEYGLPGVSLLVGAYLLVMGGVLVWRFMARAAASDQAFPGVAVGYPVGLLFASGAIAFVAFVAGRWISGCAQVPAWRLLRGGASYLMSCFMVAGLVMIAAAMAAVTDDTRAFSVVAVAIPVVMALVGGEILLACLLNLYRPRTPGELPRPAFDSRLLGLLTAPRSLGEVVGELIRYQFGVEVSGNWLYRLLGQALTPLALLAGCILLALSCLVVVGPDEQGVVLRCGAIHGPAREAGIHLKWPWPFETAITHPTRRVVQQSVSSGVTRGAIEGEPILWTTGDDRLSRIGAEYYPVVLASAAGSGGLAVIDAEIVVHYHVRDLVRFLESTSTPEATVAVAAQQEACRYFATHDLDSLMSRGRTDAGVELTNAIQERLDGMELGLHVVDVSITSLQPPAGKVSRAFHRQIAAQQQRETLIEKARRTAVATLARVAGSVDLGRRLNAALLDLEAGRTTATRAAEPNVAASVAAREAGVERLLGEARGEAADLIHAARGERWTLAIHEDAARERFVGELVAHDLAPSYYQAARLLAVLAEGLVSRRKFVVTGQEGELPILRMDFADPGSAIDTLLGQ